MRRENFGLDKIDFEKGPAVKPPKVDPDKQWIPPEEGPEKAPTEWAPPREQEPEKPGTPPPPKDSPKD